MNQIARYPNIDQVLRDFKIEVYHPIPIEIIYRAYSPESLRYATEIFEGLTFVKHFEEVSMNGQEKMPFDAEITIINDVTSHKLYVNCKGDQRPGSIAL